MAIDINLVVENTQSSTNQERIKKVTSISFAVLFITAFFSFLVFLISFRFSASSVRQKQEEVITNLSIYNSTSAKLFLLTNRVSDISFLKENRINLSNPLGNIISILPSSVKISDLALKNNSLTLRVTSSSLLDLNEFLNKFLLLSTKEKKLNGVILESLTSSPEGFTMSINAQII